MHIQLLSSSSLYCAIQMWNSPSIRRFVDVEWGDDDASGDVIVFRKKTIEHIDAKPIRVRIDVRLWCAQQHQQRPIVIVAVVMMSVQRRAHAKFPISALEKNKQIYLLILLRWRRYEMQQQQKKKQNKKKTIFAHDDECALFRLWKNWQINEWSQWQKKKERKKGREREGECKIFVVAVDDGWV